MYVGANFTLSYTISSPDEASSSASACGVRVTQWDRDVEQNRNRIDQWEKIKETDRTKRGLNYLEQKKTQAEEIIPTGGMTTAGGTKREQAEEERSNGTRGSHESNRLFQLLFQ